MSESGRLFLAQELLINYGKTMSLEKKILIVDADTALITSLGEQLEFSGFVVENSVQGKSAISKIDKKSFNLIIVNSTLPDMDGVELCSLIRKKEITTPIIFLSDEKLNTKIFTGNEVDEIVLKPFKIVDILEKIQRQISRYENSKHTTFIINKFKFLPGTRDLISQEDGSVTRLTEKESAILKFLYSAECQIVPRELLLKELWGYNAKVTTHTLETHIYRLRQKLEIDSSNTKSIITETGGYKLLR